MKATTKVIGAVQECYHSFANWAWVASSIPVEPKYPDVRFRAGRGWEIDGKLYSISAAKVVEEFKRLADQWSTLAAQADRAAGSMAQ